MATRTPNEITDINRDPAVMAAEEQKNIPAKDFLRTVLQNCGEYRLKNQAVVTTERGASFLRNLNRLGSEDPAATFFGSNNNVPKNIFGDTSTQHLKDLSENSQISIALANQIGNGGART